jgi:CubicO group peptidase (beta-lactamase class C family)
MKIKALSRWTGLLVAGVLLAGTGASRPQPADRYAVLEESAGVSAKALGEAIDPLFDAAAEASTGETRAVIVLRNGRVIAERYAPGFDARSRFLSWSMAKTVTGLLVGLMVSDGLLALDDPVPVAAWQQTGDPRAAITLRQLLQMRSGLRHREDWRPTGDSDTLAMLAGEGARDQAAFAADRPMVHPDGRVFTFSSATSMILAGLMTDQLTASRDPSERRAAMARFLAARFAGPLGLRAFAADYDESGTLHGAAMMHMTARDYAAVGEFIRTRGRAGGRQLIADPWFDFMTAPSPANPAYAAHLWLNRAGGETPLFPGQASARLMAAVGERGQFVLIAPEQGVVIVRLGVTRDEEMPALRAGLARLVRRFPG